MSQAIVNYRTRGLAGEFIFPEVPVFKQSNLIPFFPLASPAQREGERSPGASERREIQRSGRCHMICKNYALRSRSRSHPENADECGRSKEWRLPHHGPAPDREGEAGLQLRQQSTNVSTASCWCPRGLGLQPVHAAFEAMNQVEDLTGSAEQALLRESALPTADVNSAVCGKLFPWGPAACRRGTKRRGSSELDEVQELAITTRRRKGQTASLAKFMTTPCSGSTRRKDQSGLAPIRVLRDLATKPGIPTWRSRRCRRRLQEVGVHRGRRMTTRRSSRTQARLHAPRRQFRPGGGLA